jgi:hypothetical protein
MTIEKSLVHHELVEPAAAPLARNNRPAARQALNFEEANVS